VIRRRVRLARVVSPARISEASDCRIRASARFAGSRAATVPSDNCQFSLKRFCLKLCESSLIVAASSGRVAATRRHVHTSRA
jgi:hypothetical protein